jgi:FkbM family methyltransferase
MVFDLVASGWRAYRRFGLRRLLANFTIHDMLYLTRNISARLRPIKGATPTTVFAAFEKNLFLNIRYDVLTLGTRGFNFLTIDENQIGIICKPLIDQLLVVDIDSLSHLELFNTLELLRIGSKYGVAFLTGNVPTFYHKTLRFDFVKKTITVPGEISFFLDSIDPWTIIETFYLGIHGGVDLHGKTVLDVGAQAGDTALYFARLGAEVYAVEPIPANFNALRRNLLLNPELSRRIHPVEAAIGPDGVLELSTGDKLGLIEPGVIIGSASGFLRPSSYTPIVVSVHSYSVSSMLRKLGLSNIDYLKMDCKGCEFLLTSDDLSLVKEMLKIEYTSDDIEKVVQLSELIYRSGFASVVANHNPESLSLLQLHGSIYAVRTR